MVGPTDGPILLPGDIRSPHVDIETRFKTEAAGDNQDDSLERTNTLMDLLLVEEAMTKEVHSPASTRCALGARSSAEAMYLIVMAPLRAVNRGRPHRSSPTRMASTRERKRAGLPVILEK